MSERYIEQPEFTVPASELVIPTLAETVFYNDARSIDLDGNGELLGALREAMMPDADVTVIMTMAITDEVGRANTRDTMGWIRKNTGARVFALGFPQMDEEGGLLTKAEKESLKEGSLEPIARRQWRTLLTHLDRRGETVEDLGQIIIVGPSAGGPQALELLATAPREAAISDVLLQSAPFTRGTLSLAVSFGVTGGRDVDTYQRLDEDADILTTRESPKEWYKRALRDNAKRNASILLGRAIGQGKLNEQIHRIALNRPELLRAVRYQVASGGKERVATPQNTILVAEYLGRLAQAHILPEEQHAWTQSRRMLTLWLEGILSGEIPVPRND